ncbi:hypothetical protein Efla_001885 [Eimeria flavescens]
MASLQLARGGRKKAFSPKAPSSCFSPDALLPAAALESCSLPSKATQETTTTPLQASPRLLIRTSTSSGPAIALRFVSCFPFPASADLSHGYRDGDPLCVPLIEPEADTLDLPPYLSESVIHMDAMGSHRFCTLLGRSQVSSADVLSHLEGSDSVTLWSCSVAGVEISLSCAVPVSEEETPLLARSCANAYISLLGSKLCSVLGVLGVRGQIVIGAQGVGRFRCLLYRALWLMMIALASFQLRFIVQLLSLSPWAVRGWLERLVNVSKSLGLTEGGGTLAAGQRNSCRFKSQQLSKLGHQLMWRVQRVRHLPLGGFSEFGFRIPRALPFAAPAAIAPRPRLKLSPQLAPTVFHSVVFEPSLAPFDLSLRLPSRMQLVAAFSLGQQRAAHLPHD